MKPLAGKKLLVIEDDLDTRLMLERRFGRAGAQVESCEGGRSGLKLFFQSDPDLVILDLLLPDVDGWETAERIIQESDTPLIILTAVKDEDSIVRGLNLGASDYVTKPFSTRVLVARSAAAMRRSALDRPVRTTISYQDERLHVNLDDRQVLVDGSAVDLTGTEYNLLAYLLANRGKVVTFEQILETVWGPEYDSGFEKVHEHIARLRRKIERDPYRPTYLHSEHGLGYRFEGAQ